MRLTDYLKRVGYEGPVRPDLETLTALHRAHQFAVPFENLDVQLGRKLSASEEEAFDKIVTRRRGGWCYEMNGVFAWVLREIGFDVTRMAGGVRREGDGDAVIGNHLCLLVRLEQPYLADVGFGGSLTAPMPLAVAERADAPFALALGESGDGYWRFRQHLHDEYSSYDFHAEAADEALLSRMCVWQQMSEQAPFVHNLVSQMRVGDAHVILRGRALTRVRAAGAEKTLLNSADELLTTLRDVYGLDEPEAASLWPRICARHEALFAGA